MGTLLPPVMNDVIFEGEKSEEECSFSFVKESLFSGVCECEGIGAAAAVVNEEERTVCCDESPCSLAETGIECEYAIGAAAATGAGAGAGAGADTGAGGTGAATCAEIDEEEEVAGTERGV